MVSDSNIINLLGNRVIHDPGELKSPTPPDAPPSDSTEEDPHIINMVSDGKEENIAGFRMVGRTTREYLTEMHPVDRVFADQLSASELSSVEKLSLINTHVLTTALPIYDSSEVSTGHNVRGARDVGRGDCDDRARLAYAIAVHAGVEQKNLGLAIGGMDTNAPDSQNFSLGGHATLVYFDEQENSLFAFEPEAFEGIKLQAPDKNSPNDVFAGVLNFRDGGNNSADYSLVIDYLYTNGKNVAVSREAQVTPASPDIKQPAAESTPAAAPQPR